mgnify:CR=1 FL=1|jgi:hypothetical protein
MQSVDESGCQDGSGPHKALQHLHLHLHPLTFVLQSDILLYLRYHAILGFLLFE